ncbi:MAG: pilin [Candidatus Altiarchaeota archaeon]
MRRAKLMSDIFENMRLFENVNKILVVLFVLSTLTQGQMSSSSISSPVNEILCMIYNGIYQIAASLAVLVFVFAGVKYVSSMDDPGKRKSAKDTMIAAIIGLIIVSIGKALVNQVLESVLGSGYSVSSACLDFT